MYVCVFVYAKNANPKLTKEQGVDGGESQEIIFSHKLLFFLLLLLPEAFFRSILELVVGKKNIFCFFFSKTKKRGKFNLKII